MCNIKFDFIVTLNEICSHLHVPEQSVHSLQLNCPDVSANWFPVRGVFVCREAELAIELKRGIDLAFFNLGLLTEVREEILKTRNTAYFFDARILRLFQRLSHRLLFKRLLDA